MLPFKGFPYAPALAALHALCFLNPWSEQTFQALLNLSTTFGFCDETGFILCSDLGDDLEILTLAVHPDYRRKGKASLLLESLQDYAKTHKKHKIFLEVNQNNLPAQHLYAKHHFRQTAKRSNYYHEQGRTFDALCFEWQNPQF